MSIHLIYIGKISKKSFKKVSFLNWKVFISSETINHIFERREKIAKKVILFISEIISNPTKISDNSVKRIDSYIFIGFNEKIIGVVIEKTKTTGVNQVVFAFPINARTYRKIIDISGRAESPPFEPLRFEGNSQQILSDVGKSN
jgi:hypothetical protein